MSCSNIRLGMITVIINKINNSAANAASGLCSQEQCKPVCHDIMMHPPSGYRNQHWSTEPCSTLTLTSISSGFTRLGPTFNTKKKKLMSALLYGSKEMYFGLYATLISWWCPNETQAMRNELWINLGHPRFFNMHLMFDTRVFAFCEHQSVTKNWPHGYHMAPMHQQQYAIATGPLWKLICLVQHPSFVSTIEKDA